MSLAVLSVSSFNSPIMTLLSFFGCGLTAYGPALAIFFLYVAKNAQLVLLMVSSAFFWLVSILFASAIWYLATPAQDNNVVTIAYSVLLQELFRWLLFLLIK
ncbi:gamma-secretase subunit APH-1B-like protein [Endogone sp. FLAS-F59071]|nr:gamma-secretase subunit APH-1B-like protein [Endogone sp. FLAS-F59071]|eukprot:RUS21556.1 gamma-secretase subunit APH-1B-like protein [Endogone sp. FLAS-F59071]